MQQTDDITVCLGEAQVRVPPQAAARAYLEKLMTQPQGPAPSQPATRALPAIGDDYQGGTYAGITIEDNRPMMLILMPFRIEKTGWQNACSQAAAQDGDLPSRIDALVLFKNLREKFEKAWCWTSEQDEFGDAYAWLQDFDDGYQPNDRKSVEHRAFVVRRLPIH